MPSQPLPGLLLLRLTCPKEPLTTWGYLNKMGLNIQFLNCTRCISLCSRERDGWFPSGSLIFFTTRWQGFTINCCFKHSFILRNSTENFSIYLSLSLALLRHLQDHSCLIRNQTWTPCSGSTVLSMNCQGIPLSLSYFHSQWRMGINP